ncbi:DUF7331 family protein [Haloferacaceae archaeon DSL9]
MPTHATQSKWDRADTAGAEPDSVASVESYRIDGGVVFYDAFNPLAWVETTQTVRLADLR